MTREELDQFADERGLEILVMDGQDHALVGLWWQEDKPIAVYSEEKILEGFEEDGMEEDEAREFYEYNVVRGCEYMGEGAPIIIQTEV